MRTPTTVLENVYSFALVSMFILFFLTYLFILGLVFSMAAHCIGVVGVVMEREMLVIVCES